MAKKILLVDDEPALLFVLTQGLKKRGYEVFCGRDGREALDLAPQLMPDLILLDVGLPALEGDEVTLLLKKDDKLKNIPVFLISSVTAGLGEKAAACGADAYLEKPFSINELSAMIEKYCAPKQP